MTRVLVLVTRWIGLAHDRWRARIAHPRPFSIRIDTLREEARRLREEDEQLRARLRRLPYRRRSRKRPHERLRVGSDVLGPAAVHPPFLRHLLALDPHPGSGRPRCPQFPGPDRVAR